MPHPMQTMKNASHTGCARRTVALTSCANIDLYCYLLGLDENRSVPKQVATVGNSFKGPRGSTMEGLIVSDTI